MVENAIKLDNDYLDKINDQSCDSYFGDWIRNIDHLIAKFLSS